MQSLDGEDLGTVKELDWSCFKVARAGRRDYWLAKDAIATRSEKSVTLLFASDRLSDARVDVSGHEGPHSHGQGGLRIPRMILLLLGAAGVGTALANKRTRQKALSTAKKLARKTHVETHDSSVED